MNETAQSKAQPTQVRGEQQPPPTSSRASRQRPKVSGLNLPAMLDVTFQLLIFFLLTANFMVDEGLIPADLPTGVSETQQISAPQEPLVIVLRSVGDDVVVWVERAPNLTGSQKFQQLYTVLSGWRLDEKNPDGIFEPDNPIVIKPLRNVRWHAVVDTFNACIRAKYTNVSFAQAG